MPPQRVHRMVQYSHPPRLARPGMMLITTRPALHCGQLDSMGGPADRRCPVSSCGIARPKIAWLEAIDMVLGVRDRVGRIGPCESDFECGKRQTVDDDRLLIGPLDPGMPQARSGLKGFDLKAVVIAGHFVLRGCAGMTRKPRNPRAGCEAVHTRGKILWNSTSNSSCPDLNRASTSFFTYRGRGWPGRSPAMTEANLSAARGDVVGEHGGVVADARQERGFQRRQPLQAEEIEAGNFADATTMPR